MSLFHKNLTTLCLGFATFFPCTLTQGTLCRVQIIGNGSFLSNKEIAEKIINAWLDEHPQKKEKLDYKQLCSSPEEGIWLDLQNVILKEPNLDKTTDFNIPSFIKKLTLTNCKLLTNTFANLYLLQEISSVDLKEIPNFGFANCYALKKAYLPALQTIGKSAFSSCYSLESICASEIQKIDEEAFSKCYKLQCIYLANPSLTEDQAYFSCTGVKYVFLNKLTQLGKSAFSTCSSLVNVFLPNLENINNDTFGLCTKLVFAHFPKANFIGGMAFWNCKNLQNVDVHNVKEIKSYAFWLCESLKELSIPYASFTNYEDPFMGCNELEHLQLGIHLQNKVYIKGCPKVQVEFVDKNGFEENDSDKFQ